MVHEPQSPVAWLVVADAEQATLLKGETVGGGHPHVDIVDQTTFQWEGHEHHRPSPLQEKSHHTHAAFHHEQEEELHRFVKQFIGWLEAVLKRHPIESLTLFAPPAFIGEFRRSRPGELADRLTLVEAELAHLDAARLQSHPAIQQHIGHISSASRTPRGS